MSSARLAMRSSLKKKRLRENDFLQHQCSAALPTHGARIELAVLNELTLCVQVGETPQVGRRYAVAPIAETVVSLEQKQEVRHRPVGHCIELAQSQGIDGALQPREGWRSAGRPAL